ncbi:MAG: hypothetical protein AAFO29_08230, partial [Actinomycetota bacterium]
MGLGARLALLFAAVAAGTALLVGGVSYLTTDRQASAEIDTFLRERANEFNSGERDQPRSRRADRGNDNDDDNNDGGDNDPGDADEDDSPVVAFSPDAEVQILDEDGNVLTNSGLLLPIDEIDLQLAADAGPDVLRTVTIGEIDYRMITDHLDGGGAVQVARSLEETINLLGVLQTQLIVVTGLLALAAGASGWFLAQRTTRPLRLLTEAVDEVAEHPVEPPGQTTDLITARGRQVGDGEVPGGGDLV